MSTETNNIQNNLFYNAYFFVDTISASVFIIYFAAKSMVIFYGGKIKNE